MMRRLLWSFLVLSLVLLHQTEGWRRRRRRRCPRTNCAVSSWTREWSTCTRSCGYEGTQYRTRTVTRGASCGGSCPYTLRETRNCNKHNCPVNGGWSSWGVWTTCSKPCGSGIQARTRSCTQPRPQHGGKTCPGTAREQRRCNTHSCPVDGGWSSWGLWTTCSKPCGSGTQARTRSCTQPRPQNGGKTCPGTAREQRRCNTHSCPVHGGWSSWSVSTPCSVTCGRGVEVLSRTCTNPAPQHGGRPCSGDARKHQVCVKQHCPVNGGWSSWGVWTTCTKSCDSGTQARTRSCTRPPPQYGGKNCPKAAREQRVCNTHSCPVHGGWSSWVVSTPCSVTCGSGVEVLSRTCTNPAPQHGGRRCQGTGRKQQACTKKHCPIDGGWSGWGVWTTCTKPCESGTQVRTRSCTQPSPQNGGETCPGAAMEQRVCNTHSCPVHGGWSAWVVSTPCSVTCGSGVEVRSRTCTNPSPNHGGRLCQGTAREKQVCTKKPCPVHGGWSGWSSWSPCGKTCGGGSRERTRSCTNPPPYFGGKGCGTHHYESKECAMNTCPVHGGWSSWSGWSSCSKSCGTGFLERSRSCTQPAPSPGGKPCPGTDRESSWCNSHACPVDGGWSEWGNWTDCSVTCGIGAISRDRKCDNPAPAAGGRPCQGYSRDVKSCNTTKICIDRVGCYRNFPSTYLGSFRDEIEWFVPPFSKQMQKMVDKCARLAMTKGLRYFGVENLGNCYGAKDYSSGGELMAVQCNFGVGLENHFFIYKVST